VSDKGLPVNLEAERLVLGSILLDQQQYNLCAGVLSSEDFMLEKHRIIYRAITDLYEKGEKIDAVTVTEEIMRRNMLAACGGISYIVSLDDGLPSILNLDAYVRIVLEKSTLRKCIYACQQIASRCMMAEDGAQDILQDAETLLARVGEAGQQKHGKWLDAGQVMLNGPGGLQGFLMPEKGGTGIPTPWAPITESLCGLHPGDLFLVAGRPSMGKSIVAGQLAHKAAKEEYGTAIFSLEMSKESIVRRLVSAIARIDAQRLRVGCLNAEERQRAVRAANEIKGLPLWIDDSRARTMTAITAALRKLMARQKVRLLVIDHLQLMKGASGRNDERRSEALGEISHHLKTLAGELDLTVILVSQPNRQCEIENRRPQLSDLKETGSLEEDADVVLFVHRPERYAKNHAREDLKGEAEFIIAKQRNGPTGLKNMVFLAGFQKFECRAQDRTGLEDL